MTHILLLLQLVSPGVTTWMTVGEFDSNYSCSLAGALLVEANSGSTTRYACLPKKVDSKEERQ